jgi:hypothetical protein
VGDEPIKVGHGRATADHLGVHCEHEERAFRVGLIEVVAVRSEHELR